MSKSHVVFFVIGDNREARTVGAYCIDDAGSEEDALKEAYPRIMKAACEMNVMVHSDPLVVMHCAGVYDGKPPKDVVMPLYSDWREAMYTDEGWQRFLSTVTRKH
jgi:hypothetical protein